MSARKLQQEMERVFKRVAEGTMVFDQIYEKLQNSANQSQKEKLEADLKKELKKLQKLRDQIKTWIGSNDVRDKKQLLEQRRLIENEMERFKVVEREVKTKAWSRESNHEDDPHYQENQATCEFLQQQIDALEEQTETLEQEQENLQGSMRKGKKDTAKLERIAEIEHSVERNKWHVHQMEIMIRMIENETLAHEAVDELKDDILYYVESNQEVDFAEDEAIYDDLGLVEDEGDEGAEVIVRDDTYTLEDLAQDLSKEREIEKEKDKKSKTKEREKTPVAGASTAPTSAGTTPVAPSVGSPSPTASPTKDHQITPPPGISPLPPPKKKGVVPLSTTGSGATTMAAAVAAGPHASSAATPVLAPSASNLQASVSPPPVQTVNLPDLPACLTDLKPGLAAAKVRALNPQAVNIGPMLEASVTNAPDAVMADRPRYYYPESPYPTPDYYPSESLASLDNPQIFAKMDVDTLFYIFYYRQGSYQQYLAARELKSRSWRFHKRFLTWFQRHEEPKIINPEFEQGTYRFFDFEGSWLQRRKSNFKFEYQYLEDEV